MGPMMGMVSLKSWKVWLIGHPRGLALGTLISVAIQLFNSMYTVRDEISMRVMAFKVNPRSRHFVEGWRKPSIWLKVWPGQKLRHMLMLLV